MEGLKMMKMKKIRITAVALSLVLCCVLSSALVSAKTVTPKKGFYVWKTETNCQRMTIDKVKGKKITFELAYCGLKEDFSTKTTVKLKDNKAKFTVKDDWGNTVTGTIKIVSSKKIKVKCSGNALFSTGKWITYTYINSNADISQVY
jgi:hypothetical protein